ncbi:MAG: hypothetical protein FRX48_07868 [Lasallia pustulata]|uniref:Uncharacterized protein n=1 Tax=Lasallia pustulata TaxID=136370 RepID=A0A5M8PFM3_9LECA|nr:MAG: hypothetical protein FRX48_07868 [Lasallia pustulata]
MTARIPPPEILPPTAPHRRMIIHEHILRILTPSQRFRLALDRPAGVILDVALTLLHDGGLSPRRRLHILLSAVLIQQHLGGFRQAQLRVAGLLAAGILARGGVALQVGSVPVAALLRLPGVADGFLELGGVAGGAHEVVFGDEGGGLVGGRAAVDHGARFGVVFGRVEVEVDEVFGGVFADAEVAGGGALVPAHVGLFGVFGFFLIFVGGGGFAIFCEEVLAFAVLTLGLLFQILELFVLLDNGPVFCSIIPVPAVPLRIPTQVHLLHHFIRLDIFARPFRPLGSGSTQTVFRFMRHSAAVLAGAFTEFGSCRPQPLATIIPY